MPRSFVVSLHDVSPHTCAACATMLRDLAAWGVARTSLLVVADHHRRGHFLADPDFCRWLAECARAGHELVVHGYYHRRERRPGESTRDRFVTRIYTADEGEFYDLPRAAAAELLARALDDFARFRREYAPELTAPGGFIAPAWLLGDEARAAVIAAGFGYTTTLRAVEDLARGRSHSSQSLVYSPRNAWRRVVSLGWNALLFRRLAANPLMRLGVHPPDLQHAALWRQIGRLTRRAVEDRTPCTYAEWVAAS
ncbi:MAG: polysaccharide deacetylase family protein [Verrucomicrobia bacterium]|nr:polysaccharide deacetylase family protein [Verrucomicrobiota bacterium]